MPQVGSLAKSSPYRGVGWHKKSGKWQATIWYDGKLNHLGLFPTESEAAKAYDEKAKEVWGADAFLNFPAKRRRTKGPALVGPDALADAVLELVERGEPLTREHLEAAFRALAGS